MSQRACYQRDGYRIAKALVSGDTICALEDEATRIADTHLLAVHFPHKLSARFHAMLSYPAIIAQLTELIGPDIKAIQSMLFVKPPGMPGQAWHQDEHFLPTRDRSLCGVWIALDDATIANGCLWVHPGSHQRGVLHPMRAHEDPRFDVSDAAFGFAEDTEGGVPVELARGDAVFFNGYLLHRSLPNRAAEQTRRALVIHYMSALSLLPWNHDGKSPTEDFRDIVMVAGEDPYAWKGISDLSRPFVRSQGSR